MVVPDPSRPKTLWTKSAFMAATPWLVTRPTLLLAAAARANRRLALDQDSVKATLRPGKNKVLLKVNNVGGGWGFALRITDPEGKPLELESTLGE